MEALVREHFGPVVGKMPGVVVALVTHGEEHLLALGSIASHSHPRDDCWEIGSITKVFTGMLLAEMVMRGEVRLDDPIGQHLPADVAARLPAFDLQPTLEDLATHYAGFSSIPVPLLVRARGPNPYAKLDERQVFDQLGSKTNRPNRPKFRYSNFGMGLLGHILERAAGQPYANLVRERLLDPLGLAHTGVGGCGAVSETVAGFRKGKPAPPWDFAALAACGAMRSTPSDLVRFAQAMLTPPKGPLGEAIRLASEARRDGAGRDMRVGLGWMTRSTPTGTVLWHNGGTYGASSFIAVDRDRSAAVIALGNSGPRLVPRLDGPSWAMLADLGGVAKN
jgi:CubicO group peptidase (beta-lactamase class C family)